MRFDCTGGEFSFVKKDELNDEKYISFKVDSKLLHRILKGPKFAHWNTAEIGCHVMFNRKPDVYHRGLHFCMNYFHA